jgi:hypothetical protein
MTALPAAARASRPAADLLRVVLTYVLPSLAVLYVVLAGLWLVPDILHGMYGNHDGRWASWGARAIWQWSGFLDFSPFSPLSGIGSPFLPNQPWLDPGALALALPAPLPLRHLISMLAYFAELSASLYLLYRHLQFSLAQSYLATLLYICVFFIPLSGYTGALPHYAIAPMHAHEIAMMNVATIAMIRLGAPRLASNLLLGLVLIAALFAAFVSGPVTSMVYVPVYGVLWLMFLIPWQQPYRVVLWRWGAVASALLLLAAIGVPRYLGAMALVSARGEGAPEIFHPGWRLLSPSYWWQLAAQFPVCTHLMQMMCARSIMGWFEIAALAGAICLALFSSGVKRRYGVVIVVLLAMLHFNGLLQTGMVLGRLHLIGTPFLMWTFFPLAPPAIIALGSFVAERLVGRGAVSEWLPAAAACLIATFVVVVWQRSILPYQPRLPGSGPLGLAPIAHLPIKQGLLIDYLQRQIGLAPGSEFRGYAATFLGAPDGLVRRLTGTPAERMTYDAYIDARDILYDRFGNRFINMDLWESGIPTFEEYGQSVSKQMFDFNRDLLAEPQDQIDPAEHHLLVYRFRVSLLRALGVRFVLADGSLADAGIVHVMAEPGKSGDTMHLYEIKDANRGQFSPTQVTWAADYAAAVRALRADADLDRRVVLLGPTQRLPELVAATRARLTVVRDGYRVAAAAPGTAMLLLPVQFSHCWQVENRGGGDPPRIIRANIVQTGILFKESVDATLRFDFQPWRSSCRLDDASDLTAFGFK